jgi:Tol biopolymer transport system component
MRKPIQRLRPFLAEESTVRCRRPSLAGRRAPLGLAVIAAALSAGLGGVGWAAQTPNTTRVSVGPGGTQATRGSDSPSVSADGRLAAFVSRAPNLVAGDTNGRQDVFVHDRASGGTTRVSVSSRGRQGNDDSGLHAAISADGRFVAFTSRASNLVAGDTNGQEDVFVHDRTTGRTTRVNVSSRGRQGNGESSVAPAISADGRFVAFASRSSNLVAGDTNRKWDVFVHDRRTNITSRVSVGFAGQANGHSIRPSISADGRYVVFSSVASNLVARDTNHRSDVFVRDRRRHVTSRVSVGPGGQQAAGRSFSPAISADGRVVAFWSDAPDIVSDDTNGQSDVFVYDRGSATATRVSVTASGEQSAGASGGDIVGDGELSISADGRRVAFTSGASDLVPGDTNGAIDVFVHDRLTGSTERESVGGDGTEADDHSLRPAISADGRSVAFESLATNLVPGDTNARYDVFVRGPLG